MQHESPTHPETNQTHWSTFYQQSQNRYISYWLQYLIDHQTNHGLLDADENNIKTAWLAAAKQKRESDLLETIEPLYQFYRTRGRVNEGQDMFASSVTLLSRSDNNISNLSPTRQKLIGRLLAYQAWYSWNLAQYVLAETLVDQALNISQQIDDQKNSAFLLSVKGSVLRYGYGDPLQAGELYFRSYKRYQNVKDHWGMASSLINVGLANCDAKNYGNAIKLFERASIVCQQHGYNDLLARCFNNLGITFTDLGQDTRAIDAYHKCYNLCQQMQNKLGMAFSLGNQSQLALKNGHFSQAKSLSQKQIILSKEIDNGYLLAGGLADLGNTQYMLGEHHDAWETLQEGLDVALKIGATPSIIQVISQIARFFYHQDDIEISLTLLTIIQPFPFPAHHLGDPENLYELLVSKLTPETVEAIHLEWEGKELDDAVHLIQSHMNDYTLKNE